jgi:uncharacterized RmlC-like cupin family protein
MTRADEAPWSDHRSGMLIQFGVSAERSGSTQVFMTHQKLPPAMRSTPHFHTNCETAMYILKGPLAMRYGEKLQHQHEVSTGDYLFIPQNAIHQIVNLSADAEGEVVLCRNASEELVQEVEGLE